MKKKWEAFKNKLGSDKVVAQNKKEKRQERKKCVGNGYKFRAKRPGRDN